MIYLGLSILLNAYIGIAFILFKKCKVDLFQTIVYNYAVCVITGCMVLGYFPIQSHSLYEAYFPWAILMGGLFIAVFSLLAISSVRVGVTITQTANKLSLIIPVLFSYVLYHEEISILKFSGILVAILAIVFVTNQLKEDGNSKVSLSDYILPLSIFIGSGFIDAMTKYVQQAFLQSEEISNAYLISGFFSAFVIGCIFLLLMYIRGKKKFEAKNLLAAIALGVPNYFSIYFLVKALQDHSLSSSAIIPINNIGVLFVVSLFGIFLFKEKLTKINYAGLALTIFAIVLIFFGDGSN
ncbi:MAG: EamA family transporter [Bacteroidetes bacterium]|nr:EamA family transporter [Bacteroidota bacterium]